uniref:RRM domain-containing protein n=1 Tax=Mola mola TaxID=94237 RepID=A0A3Q3XJP7_MOLML
NKVKMILNSFLVKGKRKAQSTATTSPSKKTKHNSDGFCVFVGNLNTSKKFVELKDALGNYLMAQSLLVQDIRLDRSKKHAHIDLASEMDLTAALKLNGELVLDKPIKTVVFLAMKDARCLFLKNLPFNATKEDIMKIFKKAVDVRFPGGSAGPTKGIAFLEFKNRTIARKVQKKKQVVEIQDRVLIVDFVGEARSKVTKVNDKDKKEAPPNDTLFVSNLSHNINKQKLKKLFQKAVSINIPQINGKPRGFAFIKFATVADAEKAFGSSQSIKLGKREVRVLFCETKEKPVLLNTLIVMGLAEKTSAETLKNAFEGALSTRIITDKDTGVSKGYGFVDFESEEKCKAVKDDMEDCEIDGSKVTVAFAKQKVEKSPPGAIKSLEVPAPAQPADQKAVRGRRGSQGGNIRVQ